MLIDSRADRERQAWAVLRLLVDDPRFDPDDLDWTLVRAVAERAGVIVRIADTIVRRGEELPPRLAESAAVACTHTQRVLEIVDQLGAACRRLGIAHAFLKTAERYPDTGRDIDLLIAEPTRDGAVDAAILRSLPAAPRKRSWRSRLAGSCTYAAASGIVIDIWHGRLGLLGEHARYARLLLERARPMALGMTTRVPPHASFSNSSVPHSSRVAGTVPHGCRCCPSWQLPPWLPVLGGRDESAVSGLLSPHAYPAAFRCRHHAWLVSQALALSRCQPKTHRRSVGTRPLDAGAVAHLARGARRLCAASRGDARPLLSRSVGGAPSQGRSRIPGVAAELAHPRKRRASRSRPCISRRWLRSQADVSRANQRDDRGTARHLPHSANRRVAACDRRRAHTRIGRNRSRRAPGAPGWPARHAGQTAASAILGLECGDESALLVVLPSRA